MFKNPKNSSFHSFVDDGFLVAQSKSLTISNSFLFCSYNIAFSLLEKFGLIMEHRKTEVFHFSRSHGVFNPLSLNLSALGGPILHLGIYRSTWILSLTESYLSNNI